MAETSDYSGWVPRGTMLQYAPPAAASSVATATFDTWDEMSALTALIILYVALAPDPHTYIPDMSNVVQPMPTTPIPEAAVTPHLGAGMWTGPGVRYYVC